MNRIPNISVFFINGYGYKSDIKYIYIYLSRYGYKSDTILDIS